MAKELTFVLGGQSFPLAPTKVERRKLYGWPEVRTTDQDGNLCRQASIDSNGMTIVPPGAIKSGMLRADGLWMENSELKPYHADGSEAEILPSSFDAEIPLDNEVDTEYLLDRNVSAVYQLDGEQAAALAALIGDKLFAFPFNYRAAYSPEDAILLAKGDEVFLLAGEKVEFSMIGIEELATLDEPDDEETADDEDLDFSMF